MNNLCAECGVNNVAKIFRIEIVFATLKPAIKTKLLNVTYTKKRWL